MQYLLDTHVLIWWITSDKRLSAKASTLIKSRRNTLFWSAASSWEVSIKYALGRLVFDSSPNDLFSLELGKNNITSLPITNEHAFMAGQLPLHHKDPFDRMLIAQALYESLGIISNDHAMRLYDVDVYW